MPAALRAGVSGRFSGAAGSGHGGAVGNGCRVPPPLPMPAHAPLSPERPGQARRAAARPQGAAGLGAAGKAWAALDGALPARCLFLPVAVTVGSSAAAQSFFLASLAVHLGWGAGPQARRGAAAAAVPR